MNLLSIIVLVEGALLVIVGAGWIHNAMKDHSAYWKMESELRTTQGDLQGARATIKARDIEMGVLHGEKMQLHAENADLREALQEAQAEIKALNMQTIEVPVPIVYNETTKPIVEEAATPLPVKRTRKKAGA